MDQPTDTLTRCCNLQLLSERLYLWLTDSRMNGPTNDLKKTLQPGTKATLQCQEFVIHNNYVLQQQEKRSVLFHKHYWSVGFFPVFQQVQHF